MFTITSRARGVVVHSSCTVSTVSSTVSCNGSALCPPRSRSPSRAYRVTVQARDIRSEQLRIAKGEIWNRKL